MRCIELVIPILVAFTFQEVNCLMRCYKCRSRGELGTCADNFIANDTIPGIKAGTCQSGWCAKMIQGTTGTFKSDDYGVATQRMCLKEGPSDNEERCGVVMVHNRKVFMCFCKGDLCNSAFRIASLSTPMLLTVFLMVYNYCGL